MQTNDRYIDMYIKGNLLIHSSRHRYVLTLGSLVRGGGMENPSPGFAC